ncbi:MAG TPA: acyltransferase [Tepidisphaeraceae bacterium]|nr:acyltransferase [Tepidisphaeraceae bacterium]
MSLLPVPASPAGSPLRGHSLGGVTVGAPNSLAAPLPLDTSPVAKAKALATERVAGFDLLRIICLLAIVWYHAGAPGTQYMTWRLPALMMISAALLAGRPAPMSLGTLARRRGMRLLGPWLAWSAVYGAWVILNAVRDGLPWHAVFEPRMLLTGPAHHLWYLPFAFLAALLVNGCTGRLDSPAPLAAAVATGAGAVTLLLASILWETVGPLGQPWPQWLYSLPAIPIGIAVGVAGRSRAQLPMKLSLVLVCTGTVLTCALIAAFGSALGISTRFCAPYGVGVLLVCGARLGVASLPRPITAITDLGLGIYLVHVLIGYLIQPLHVFDRGTIPYGVAVILISGCIVWVMCRTPVLKRMV